MKFLKDVVARLAGHVTHGPYRREERPGYGGDTRGIEDAQKLKRNADNVQRRALDDIRLFDKKQQEKKEGGEEETKNNPEL